MQNKGAALPLLRRPRGVLLTDPLLFMSIKLSAKTILGQIDGC
jgi:hypothetical protein